MIILYGALRKKFGKYIKCNVNSVYEMMNAVEANRPGFKSAFGSDKLYAIRRGGKNLKSGTNVEEIELEMKFGNTTWHVLPLPVGHGGNGFFSFIFGAILTIVGIFTPFKFLINIGISMMLGGVAQMLAPSPSVNNYSDRESPDKKPSYLFNGPFNRTATGGAVPVVYGKDVFIGSTFVSGGLSIGDLI